MHIAPPVIVPSLLAADAAQLGAEAQAAQAAGADWLHVDVMDGHFVPNLSFGPQVLAAVAAHTRLPLDVHLMIERPEVHLAAYAAAGAHHLTVHVETCPHLYRTLEQLRQLQVRVGVSLNPGTPLGALAPVLHLVDIALVMSVNPGFGGQHFLPGMHARISELADMRRRGGHGFAIAVDGGIDLHTIGPAAQAGADIFVAGSAIFGSASYSGAIEQLRAAATRGLSARPMG